jgi:hypothetical protein
MLFKVTHIDQIGVRRVAMVTAGCWADAQEQVLATWGVARVLACLRLSDEARRLRCV